MVLQVNQADLEARAQQIMQSNPDPNALVSRIFGPLDDWVMELGPYKLMLIPWTQMWWQYDQVHKSWEPTGLKAGTFRFVLVGEEIEVQPLEASASPEAPQAAPVQPEPKEAVKPAAVQSPVEAETAPTEVERPSESAYGAATLFEAKPLIWRLEFVSGPRVNQQILLGEKLSLGREVDNDVVLLDPKVSRHHALLERHDDIYMLVDQGSRNGTFLNDERLINPTPLKANDKITIGGSDIVIHVS